MTILVTSIENKDYRNLAGTLQIGKVAVRRESCLERTGYAGK
jgi:hypothetical protein